MKFGAHAASRAQSACSLIFFLSRILWHLRERPPSQSDGIMANQKPTVRFARRRRAREPPRAPRVHAMRRRAAYDELLISISVDGCGLVER